MMQDETRLPCANVFQTAYVVADIERGVEIAARHFGVPQMLVNRGVEIQTSSGIAKCHFALAFLGETQLEIIQPAGGEDRLYRDGLNANGGLALHHIGCLLDTDADWEAALAQAERDGIRRVASGDFGGLMRYAYLDLRQEVGHYLEYMQASAAGAGIFAAVPRYPGPPGLGRHPG